VEAGFAREFPNDLESLGAAQQALLVWAEASGLGAGPRHRIAMVLDELGANVLMHGHPEDARGQRAMRVTVRLGDAAAEVVLEDDGAPFDPRGKAGGPLEGPLEDVQIGGLGLFLIEQMSSRIDYERTAEGRNRTLVEIPLGA
jgi:serine/threonine-protein kinase RsbW